jgi:hypothetical protein
MAWKMFRVSNSCGLVALILGLSCVAMASSANSTISNNCVTSSQQSLSLLQQDPVIIAFNTFVTQPINASFDSLSKTFCDSSRLYQIWTNQFPTLAQEFPGTISYFNSLESNIKAKISNIS